MKKRKANFIIMLSLALGCVAVAYVVAMPLGICAMAAAVPIIYLAYKPLIPTPAPIWFLYNNHIKPKFCKKAAPSPRVTPGGFQEPKYDICQADFYVAIHGCDENDGSANAPFATFERAKQAVRELDKNGKTSVTVGVYAGEYALEQLVFEELDGGSENCPVIYKACGGQVILNGGIRLDSADFTEVTDKKIISRLSAAAHDKVRVLNLSAYGLTKTDIGKIYTMGTYHTAENYDGDWIGPQFCELYVDGKRQTIARWPNSDFARTGKVIFSYGGSESEQTGTFSPEWKHTRNPKSDIFQVDKETAEHIASWKTFEDVWMFGYWMYDWADASTPIGRFEPQKRALSPKFVSKWGVRKGAPYYFFNILEELDTEGEWYIDRNAMKLYLYPPKDFDAADVYLSVTKNSILDIRASHITFDGFTMQGTRADAVTAEGDGIVICNCDIKNVAGNAIVIKGHGNRVENCHISHVGKAGVLMDGGDREALIPGESVVENCLIHSWSEIYKTYCPAVQLNGVGNICRYNEMYHSPHEVIWYHGNDHLIECNHIHHACLLTRDGGAIYGGKNWSYYGCVVRGNVIHDLGSPYYTASAIYMDDGMSGQTICDNLMVNIPGIAIQLGGGRDLVVKNNTIINCTNTPISYDNRVREGALFGTWFHYCSEPGGLMWRQLRKTAYRSNVWQKHYPQMAAFVEDFDCSDDPRFVPNPGCSVVTDNVTVDAGPLHSHMICAEARKYGTIDNNPICPMRKLKVLFPDAWQGQYTKE